MLWASVLDKIKTKTLWSRKQIDQSGPYTNMLHRS